MSACILFNLTSSKFHHWSPAVLTKGQPFDNFTAYVNDSTVFQGNVE